MRIQHIAFAILFVLLVTGCGDYYTPKGEAPQTKTELLNANRYYTGVLSNAPVANMYYKTSSGIEGQTNNQGMFYYKQNDAISFYLFDNQNVQISKTLSAQSLITPLSFYNASSIDQSTAALNLSRFLYSIDSDSNVTNGITITTNTTPTSSDAIYFTADVNDFATGNDGDDFAYKVLNDVNKTIIDSNTSKLHTNAQLNLEFNSSYITNGTYYGLFDDGYAYSKIILGGNIHTQDHARLNATAPNVNHEIITADDNALEFTYDDPVVTQRLKRLATINTHTHIVGDSLHENILGVLQKGSMTTTRSILENKTLYILRPTGEYAVYTLNDTNTTQARFPQQYEVNTTDANWTLNANTLTVLAKLNDGNETNSTITLHTHSGNTYLATESFSDAHPLASFTNRLVTVGIDGLRFLHTKLYGTYFYVRDDGFVMKLFFDVDDKGSIAYQDTNNKSAFTQNTSMTWEIDTQGKLTLKPTSTISGVTNTPLTLQAVHDTILLATAGSNNILLYKEPTDTFSYDNFAGTYEMYIDEHNTSKARTRTPASQTTTWSFEDNKSATSDTNKYTYTLSSNGTVSIKQTSSTQRTWYIMRQYGNIFRVFEVYNDDPKSSKLITLVKQP